MTMISVDIRVLGGLPVTLNVCICSSDPDVGVFGPYVEGYEITHINNKKCKKSPNWLYNRIDATKGEDERIRDKIADKLANYEPEPYEYE